MEKVGNGYFKCRRCDKVGQWPSDRSQATHFRRCSGPMLFDKFETGRSNKKRQCMEMVAAKPTGNQLRRQIESEIPRRATALTYDKNYLNITTRHEILPRFQILWANFFCWSGDENKKLFFFLTNKKILPQRFGIYAKFHV